MSKDGTLYKNRKFLKGKTQLPYDSSIPVLGIYPKEMKMCAQRNNCTLFQKKKERKEKNKKPVHECSWQY